MLLLFKGRQAVKTEERNYYGQAENVDNRGVVSVEGGCNCEISLYPIDVRYPLFFRECLF